MHHTTLIDVELEPRKNLYKHQIMFRTMLAIFILVVGVMQGIAIGNVDLSDAEAAQTESIAAAMSQSDSAECCDTSRIIDNIPTFCKLDCKALVPLAVVTEAKMGQQHESKPVGPGNSIAGLVDLGPPKS